MKTGRRSFLQGLVAAAVATSLDVFGHVTPKAPPIITKRLVTKINPAYEAAAFEVKLIFHPKATMKTLGLAADRFPGQCYPSERYNYENGEYVRVPYFITEEVEEVFSGQHSGNPP